MEFFFQRDFTVVLVLFCSPSSSPSSLASSFIFDVFVFVRLDLKRWRVDYLEERIRRTSVGIREHGDFNLSPLSLLLLLLLCRSHCGYNLHSAVVSFTFSLGSDVVTLRV
jgi:hypothetical protein